MPEEEKDQYIDLSKWTVKELVRKAITQNDEMKKDFAEHQIHINKHLNSIETRLDDLEADNKIYRLVARVLGFIITGIIAWFGFIKDFIIKI